MSMNGTDITLLVGAVAVGCQRDVTFNENTAEIDVSCKTQRAKRVLGGRYSSDVTLDALYVFNDASYLALVTAMRSGDLVTIVRTEDGGADDSTASALVTSISNRFPDQAESTVSISLVVDGDWS